MTSLKVMNCLLVVAGEVVLQVVLVKLGLVKLIVG
jgi:hypothetical protein